MNMSFVDLYRGNAESAALGNRSWGSYGVGIQGKLPIQTWRYTFIAVNYTLRSFTSPSRQHEPVVSVPRLSVYFTQWSLLRNGVGEAWMEGI